MLQASESFFVIIIITTFTMIIIIVIVIIVLVNTLSIECLYTLYNNACNKVFFYILRHQVKPYPID